MHIGAQLNDGGAGIGGGGSGGGGGNAAALPLQHEGSHDGAQVAAQEAPHGFAFLLWISKQKKETW